MSSVLKKLLGLGTSKPEELVPESRRIEEAPKKKWGKEEKVKEVVRLGGDNGPNVLSKRVESDVKANNDQEVFQYSMPTAEMGFGDLLKDHVPGERMPGVAIAKKSSQSRTAIMRDLEQLQPDIEKRPMKLPKKFIIQLKNQEEKICLSQVFTKVNPRFPYILIKRIRFILTPLSSFFDDFTNVNAMILDTRILNRPRRQTACLNSNVDYRGSISLDYCFPISSLSKFFLYLQLEVALMEAGEEWATVMMMVEAEEMDFPVMEDYQQVSIVAHLPPSGLERYKFDPTHMDLTIRDIHRKTLLDLYEAGDLADITKPVLTKTAKTKYTSTTVSNVKGAVVAPDGQVSWEGIRQSGRQELDEISVDPSAEDSEEQGGTIVGRLKEQGLQKQRVMAGLTQQGHVEEEEESLSGLEKEALANMAQNQLLQASLSTEPAKNQKKLVGFKVDGVRED